MGALPPETADLHKMMLFVLLLGVAMIVCAGFGSWIGGMPNGDDCNPDMVVREEEPVKFWFLVTLTIVGGVALILVSALGLILT